MICAGVNGTILSGCHGDSGGPFVCQTSAGNWVLQGAVSWGSPRCSAAERYTVFARVAKFRNWIDQNMGLTPTPSIGKSVGYKVCQMQGNPILLVAYTAFHLITLRFSLKFVHILFFT